MIRLAMLAMFALVAACGKTVPNSSASQTAAAETHSRGSQDPGIAVITPQAAQASGIEVLTAGPAAIRETLTLYGTIKSNAEREQIVRARYPGVVRTVTKRPGDRIVRGETLLTIESNDSLEPYTIASPMNGNVLERSVNPGESVDATMALFRIADLSTVWAEFSVFSRDLGRVRPGLSIDIRAGESDLTASTTISYVASTGRAESQSVLVRAQLANRNNRWVAGQFVTGEVVTAVTQGAITVAPSAIQIIKNTPTVFVQIGEGFEPRAVKLGARDAKGVQILEGVNAGDKYGGKNSYLIKADFIKGEADEE